MKRTVISRLTAAALSMMMLMQNVISLATFAYDRKAPDNNVSDFSGEEQQSEESVPTSVISEKLDFSSGRLLVFAEEPYVLNVPVPMTVVSDYDGLFLLDFENEENAREAYTYYNSVSLPVEPDIALYVADDEYLQTDAAEITASVSPLTWLELLLDEEENADAQKHFEIALIDTGAEEASVDSVSVISESAVDDNGHGKKMYDVISDVSPNLSVLSVKAFDSHGIGSISSVYAAINYAVRKDVDVIALPFAAESAADSDALERAVSLAKEKDITVIGAAGNNNANIAGYLPGRVSGVTIVGACDENGVKLPSSNYGDEVFCNVTAQSTSEAAAKFAAMVAVYDMEKVTDEFGNGILFRCDEGKEEQLTEETAESSLFDPSELTEDTLKVLRNGFLPIVGDSENPSSNSKDGVTINNVTIHWVSHGAEGSDPNGTLNLEPDEEIAPNQQFQIDFDLSGQYPHEPGDIEITLPAYLWVGRDGEECGTLTLAIPAEPETNAEFVWRREGDKIIITNAQTLPASTKVKIQGTFRNVNATEIVDDTLSEDLQVSVSVETPNGETVTVQSNKINAHMDTFAEAVNAQKTAYNGTTGTYNVWWGKAPSDLPSELLENMKRLQNITSEDDSWIENYMFVRWYVEGTADGNQPFYMTVSDSVADHGIEGGFMLGASHCAEPNGYKASEDGETVEALLYEGFSPLPQSAYVWTAYPIEKFIDEEGNSKTLTIKNNQTVTVTGKDDEESDTELASAEIKIRKPTDYTFNKTWDDENNAAGKRPTRLGLKITTNETKKSQIVWLEADDEGNWSYTWNDNGQEVTYSLEEILENYKGVFEVLYDEEEHEYRWSYSKSGETYDSATHTWYYTNKYEEKWVTNGDPEGPRALSYLDKNNTYPFSDNSLISKRDNLSLNKLMLEQDVNVPYTLKSRISAAKTHLADRDNKNVFALEDTSYNFQGNDALTSEDLDIGALTITEVKAYRYVDQPYNGETPLPDGSELYFAERIEPTPEMTIYGMIDGKWTALAVRTNENGLKLAPGITADQVKINGSRLEILKPGVAGIKMEITTAAAYVEIECQPEIRIHPTPNVRGMIEECYSAEEEYSMLYLNNTAHAYAADSADPDKHFSEEYSTSNAYLHGKQYKIAADLTKDYDYMGKNKTQTQLILHSTLEMTQQSNILSAGDFIAAAEAGEFPYTKGGTFYDLLPYGADPDLSTVKVTNGDRVVAAYVKSNYRNSGRTLVVVQVEFGENLSFTSERKYPSSAYPAEGYKSSHRLEFDTYIQVELLALNDPNLDYASGNTENFHNVAAFEANEDSIGSIENWSGETDRPNGSHARTKEAFADGENGQNEQIWMTNLDPGNNDPSFVYAGDRARHDEIDLSATSSVTKYVKAEGYGTWTNGQDADNPVNVQEGGRYVYRLQISTVDVATQNIIVIDSLENYVPKPNDNEELVRDSWQGFLESVDLSGAEALGIDPVVYYYTGNSSPDVSGYGKTNTTTGLMNNLTEENDWHEASTVTDISQVKAVAFDFRYKKEKDANGNKTNFVLTKDQVIPILLYMRAPMHEEGKTPSYLSEEEPSDPTKNGHAFNEIYMSCTQSENQDDHASYISHPYTKVGIYSRPIKVVKIWDDDDDRECIRPEKITIQLYANGVAEGKPVTLDETNDWSFTFTGLPVYDEYGEYIVYTVSEPSVPEGYKLYPEISYDTDGNMLVSLTNRHEPEKISIPVEKTWDLTEGGENAMPKSITFKLFADGQDTGTTLTVMPDASGEWHGEFTGLYKYRNENGKVKEIEYRVVEESVPNFILEKEYPYKPDDTRTGFGFLNKYHPYGDLLLTKTVEDGTPASNDYTIEHKFEFILQLYYIEDKETGTVFPDTNKYPYYIYPVEGDETREQYPTLDDFLKALNDPDNTITPNGTAGNADHLYLSAGQMIILKNLPSGVNYMLTEVSRKEYDIEGKMENPGVVRAGMTETAAFTNRYVTKGSVQLHAMKLLDGRDMRAYQFRFELIDENGDVHTANNAADGAIAMNLYYENADDGQIYTYYLKEIIADQAGYTYDKTEYKITVEVHDNGNGSMSCKVTYYDADGETILGVDDGTEKYDGNIPEFQNYYEANGQIDLKAWKDLDGRQLKDGEFEFVLYDEKLDPVEFVSSEEEENEEMPDIPETPDTPEAPDTPVDDPENDNNKNKITNNSDGTVQFPPIFYTQENAGKTYYYFARELKGSDRTVIYDNSLIVYKVDVIDNGDGTLSFNQSSYILSIGNGLTECETCKGENAECETCNGFGVVRDPNWKTMLKTVASPVFNNGLADGGLSITKQAAGKIDDDQKDTVFTFHIRLVGDKLKKDKTFTSTINGTTETHTIAEDGEFEYEFYLKIGETITFDGIPAGTAYQVWEDDVDGWYLSSRVNASGLIEPTQTAEATFTNEYDEDITKAFIVGTKLLDNQPAQTDDKGNVFSFEIWEDGTLLDTVDAEAGGFIQFEMDYTKNDVRTHTYIIKEVDKSKTNPLITYDSNEFEVTVTVIEENGILRATVDYGEQTVRFKNYTVPGGLSISKKTVGLNDANKDTDFWFEISFYNKNGIPVSGDTLNVYTLSGESQNKSGISGSNFNPNDLIKNFGGLRRNIKAFNRNIASNLPGEISSPVLTREGDETEAYQPPDISSLDRDNANLKDTNNNSVNWYIIPTGRTMPGSDDEETVLLLEPANGSSGEIRNSGNAFPWKNHNEVTTILTTGNITIAAGSTADHMFSNYENLVYADVSHIDFSSTGADGNIGFMFEQCPELTTVKFQETPVRGRHNISGMFQQCTSLKEVQMFPIDYDCTEGGNTTFYFDNLFNGCSSLTTITMKDWKFTGITGFNKSSVFKDCPLLKTLDWSGLEVMSNGNTFNLNNMFAGNTTIQEVFMKNWKLSSTGTVNLNEMLRNCTALTTAEMTDWEIDAPTEFSVTNILSGCSSIITVDLSRWNINTAGTMNLSYIFQDNKSLKTFDMREWKLTGGGAVNLTRMFFQCGTVQSIDMGGWDYVKVTALCYDNRGMFTSCTSLLTLDVSGWDVGSVTDMTSLFDNCAKLTTILGLKEWNTGSVMTMNQMFFKCPALVRSENGADVFDLSGWNTSNVTSMRFMFNMEGSANGNKGSLKSLNLSGWDTSKVKSMASMFNYCTSLTELDISGWYSHTSEAEGDKGTKLEEIQYMFARCWLLTEIKGIEGLRTENVTTMEYVFYECRALKSLDLSSWRTERVTTMKSMFDGNTGNTTNYMALEVLNIAQFDTRNVGNTENIFVGCHNLKEITLNINFFNSSQLKSLNNNKTPGNDINRKWVRKDEITEEKAQRPIFDELRGILTENPATYVWATYEFYVVEYNKGSDDAVGSMSKDISALNAEYVIKDCAFTRKGWLFVGWQDDSGNVYKMTENGNFVIPANTYSPSGTEVTLTAIWLEYDETKGIPYYLDIYKENPYYDPNDNNSVKYLFDTTIIQYVNDINKDESKTIVIDPSSDIFPKEQITDEEYYVTPNAQNVVFTINSALMHVSMYYDLKHYTIHFEGNAENVMGSKPDLDMVLGVKQALGIGFFCDGMRFVSWNTDSGGSGGVYDAVTSIDIKDLAGFIDDNGTVTLYAQWADLKDEPIKPTNGKIIVHCKAGEIIMIENIPAGTTYTIEEIDFPEGWSFLSANGENVEGSIISGTIISNQFSQASMTNLYSATGSTLIQAHKNLIGDTLQPNAFTFELYHYGESVCRKTDNYNDKGELGEFIEPHVDTEQSVTISDAKRLHVELHYNSTADTGKVQVSDGKTVLYETPNKAGITEFDIEGNTVTFIPVSDITGTTDYWANVSEIIIDTAKNGLLVQGDGDDEWDNTAPVWFNTLQFTEEGEYVYYIREVVTNDPTMRFDEHIVKVKVNVTDNGKGVLLTNVTYYDIEENGTEKQTNGALFQNEKKTGQLEFSKDLIDPSGTAGDTVFDLDIYLEDASGNPINGVYQVIKGKWSDITNNTGDDPPTIPDEWLIEPITFVDGKYTFSIKGGETFTIIGLPDGAKYTITEQDKLNFRQTEATGDSGEITGGSTSVAWFTNVHTTSDLFQLIAKKNFIGGDISQNSFTFEMLDSGYNLIETVTSNTDGIIVFSAITFTQDDIGKEYIYYVREIAGQDSNITYDTEMRTIKVAVEKDEATNGLLIKLYVKNGEKYVLYEDQEDTYPVEFTNILHYDITVSKSVIGNLGNRTKKFEFTLTLDKDQFQDGFPKDVTMTNNTETVNVTFDDNGAYTFELAHDESITFQGIPVGTNYTIEEAENTDYKVEITVTGGDATVTDRKISGTLSADVDVAYQNICKIMGELPGAGYFGGTKWIYLLGTVIILSGLLQAALYIRRRRRNDEKTM